MWFLGVFMPAVPRVHGGEPINISDSSDEQTPRPYLCLTKGETYFLLFMCILNSVCLVFALWAVIKLTSHLFVMVC